MSHWPELGPPVFTVESQAVISLTRPNYVQVVITASLEGQIPSDQCAWLVEFVSETRFHPKRALAIASPPQHVFCESYLTSGNPSIQRRPAVIIVSRLAEYAFWHALDRGRVSGVYEPLDWVQTAQVPAPAMGSPYTT